MRRLADIVKTNLTEVEWEEGLSFSAQDTESWQSYF
jgi:hypothetical protein